MKAPLEHLGESEIEVMNKGEDFIQLWVDFLQQLQPQPKLHTSRAPVRARAFAVSKAGINSTKPGSVKLSSGGRRVLFTSNAD